MIHQGYYDLFEVIALGAAGLAEKVLDQEKKNNDLTAYATAKKMRDNYLSIKDKAKNKEPFEQTDWANLLIATNLMLTGINANIEKQKAVAAQYSDSLIPKITKVVEASADEYEKISQEIFEINT